MGSTYTATHHRERFRAAAVLAGVALLLLGLCGRVLYINSAFGARLSELAREQQSGTSSIPARRGTIFDSRGRIVATSSRRPDVFVDPTLVADVDALSNDLAARLNVAAEEIAAKIRRRPDSRFVPIARRVSLVTSEAIRTLHHPAVGLADQEVREYPLSESMAHVLGFVGNDGHGLEGLELAYDEHLRGKDGNRPTVRDARRRALWRSGEGGRPPEDGGHIILTIDAEIQRIAGNALAEAVRHFEAESGVAIVMSPRDGAVLAMVNVPSYDPQHILPNSEDLRRNRAVTDPTEPGSTFKPFIACGALDGGFVSRDDKFDCHMGTHRFGRRTVRDVSPHGLLTVEEIIIRSSNIGMALIAERMGNEALHGIIRRFGFGERTGIECPGDSAGIVYNLRHWTSYSTTSVSFGYEIAVTPLQLATAFCAIVNDGILLRPRLVSRLLNPDGTVLRSFDAPEVVRRVVSSEIARYMTRQVLVSVVEQKATKAGSERYTVLGKTGTAKLPYRNRAGYEDGAYMSAFVGASPASDPRIVALVMIRRPNHRIAYYGGQVAAPAVGRILEATQAYLEVPPDKHTSIAGL